MKRRVLTIGVAVAAFALAPKLLVPEQPVAPPAAGDAKAPGVVRFTGRTPFRKDVVTVGAWRIVSFEVPGGDFEKARATAEFDLRSLETKDRILLLGLRSEAWLDVEKFPTATVTLANPRPIDPVIDDAGNRVSRDVPIYVADGTLTLRGITQPCSVNFEVVKREPAIEVAGTATVNRELFGVGPQFSKDNTRDYSPIVAVEFGATLR